jgi:CRP-like cAMP-binding protein
VERGQADGLFVIKSGYVRIQVGNRTMADLTADNIFGEMALIDSEPRSATAMAITDVELVPISEQQFLFLVSQTRYFALKVIRILARHRSPVGLLNASQRRPPVTACGACAAHEARGRHRRSGVGEGA